MRLSKHSRIIKDAHRFDRGFARVLQLASLRSQISHPSFEGADRATTT